MTKYIVATLSAIALLAAGAGFGLSDMGSTDSDLRRVECQAITMFTPARSRSADELCANYGGVALQNAAPSAEGLVILVRNQPVGGFEGHKAVR